MGRQPVIAPINEVQEIRNTIKAYGLLEILNPNNLEDLLKAHFIIEVGLIDNAGYFRSKSVGVASRITVATHRLLNHINLISLQYITIMRD